MQQGEATSCGQVRGNAHDWYQSTSNDLLEASRESQRNFDKMLIPLSTGALGFTLGIWTQMGSAAVVATISLIISWLAFGGAVLLSLSSFWIAARTHSKNAQTLRDASAEGKSPMDAYTLIMNSPGSKLIRQFNAASFICFGTGVVFVILFAVLTLLQGKDASMAKQGPRETLKAVTSEHVVAAPLNRTTRDSDEVRALTSDQVVARPVSGPRHQATGQISHQAPAAPSTEPTKTATEAKKKSTSQ